MRKLVASLKIRQEHFRLVDSVALGSDFPRQQNLPVSLRTTFCLIGITAGSSFKRLNFCKRDMGNSLEQKDADCQGAIFSLVQALLTSSDLFLLFRLQQGMPMP